MKKAICLFCVLAALLVWSSPVFATSNGMVPSVTYKETPPVITVELKVPQEVLESVDISPELKEKIESGDETFQQVDNCLVITSVIQAETKATDISQETRDVLLEVYEALSEGAMVHLEDLLDQMNISQPTDETTPTAGETTPSDGETTPSNVEEKKDYVVLQLVDISFQQAACKDCDHMHDEALNLEGVEVSVIVDLGVSPDAEVKAVCFKNDKWNPVKSVVNNGDGTVTCVFDHFCPVAFCVEASEVELPQDETQPQETLPQEEEPPVEENNSILWVVLVVCAAFFLFLIARRRKKDEEK